MSPVLVVYRGGRGEKALETRTPPPPKDIYILLLTKFYAILKKGDMKEQGKLDGVNKKCASCVEDCKQFKQVTVVFCPNYLPNKDCKSPNSEKCI